MENTVNTSRKMVAVNDIQPDELYVKMLGVIKRKQFFIDGIKQHGQINLPIVYATPNGRYNALTHIADIEAAREIGTTAIEVQVRVISPEERMKFLLLSSLYNYKEHAAMSIAIDYVLEHFKTPAGKIWYESIPGDKEEVLAYLFGTSESTIKRLLKVSRNHPELLALVQEGNMDWKTMTERIAEEEAQKAKAAETPTKQATGKPKSGADTGVGGAKTEVGDSVPKTGSARGSEDEEGYGYSESEDSGGEDAGEQGNEAPTDDVTAVTQTATCYKFTEANFTMEDGRKLMVTLKDDKCEFTVDGQPIRTVFTYQYDLGKGRNTEHYTNMFSHPDLMGDCSFQVIIDNPNKLFRK